MLTKGIKHQMPKPSNAKDIKYCWTLSPHNGRASGFAKLFTNFKKTVCPKSVCVNVKKTSKITGTIPFLLVYKKVSQDILRVKYIIFHGERCIHLPAIWHPIL